MAAVSSPVRAFCGCGVNALLIFNEGGNPLLIKDVGRVLCFCGFAQAVEQRVEVCADFGRGFGFGFVFLRIHLNRFVQDVVQVIGIHR